MGTKGGDGGRSKTARRRPTCPIGEVPEKIRMPGGGDGEYGKALGLLLPTTPSCHSPQCIIHSVSPLLSLQEGSSEVGRGAPCPLDQVVRRSNQDDSSERSLRGRHQREAQADATPPCRPRLGSCPRSGRPSAPSSVAGSAGHRGAAAGGAGVEGEVWRGTCEWGDGDGEMGRSKCIL